MWRVQTSAVKEIEPQVFQAPAGVGGVCPSNLTRGWDGEEAERASVFSQLCMRRVCNLGNQYITRNLSTGNREESRDGDPHAAAWTTSALDVVYSGDVQLRSIRGFVRRGFVRFGLRRNKENNKPKTTASVQGAATDNQSHHLCAVPSLGSPGPRRGSLEPRSALATTPGGRRPCRS